MNVKKFLKIRYICFFLRFLWKNCMFFSTFSSHYSRHCYWILRKKNRFYSVPDLEHPILVVYLWLIIHANGYVSHLVRSFIIRNVNCSYLGYLALTYVSQIILVMSHSNELTRWETDTLTAFKCNKQFQDILVLKMFAF